MRIPAAYWDRATLLLLLGLCVASAVALAAGIGPLGTMRAWFDPLFFQYNLALLLVMQVSLPLITFIYVRKMRGEKERRLARELPPAVWAREREGVQRRLEAHFRFRNYLGSVLIAMVVITFGLSIILLLKPASGARTPADGVDYARGVNFLTVGPVIEMAATDPRFYHRVILSLTAFQFGFLGGYVYFIGHLVRSYFTLDLNPHTYVESAVRMATASMVALVLSFMLPSGLECSADAPFNCMSVPVVSFFLGYFPSRALLLLEKTATRIVRLSRAIYNAMPLSVLAGMSYAHEVRLLREGFDSAENLSHADALDLAIRTGFGYRQLHQWIGEAWLRRHLRADYDAFVRRTALTSRHDLDAFMQDWEASKRPGDLVAHMAGDRVELAMRIDGLCALLRHARSGHDHDL
jgi:hypothetical protein